MSKAAPLQTRSSDSDHHRVLQPANWPKPKGYANGIKARGDMIFLGGLIGWDEQGNFPDGLVAQAEQALKNIVTVLAEGDARPEHLVRLTWYVLDLGAYHAALKPLGAVYRSIIGDHFPAMTLVEVKRLDNPNALLEIEATAIVPG